MRFAARFICTVLTRDNSLTSDLLAVGSGTSVCNSRCVRCDRKPSRFFSVPPDRIGSPAKSISPLRDNVVGAAPSKCATFSRSRSCRCQRRKANAVLNHENVFVRRPSVGEIDFAFARRDRAPHPDTDVTQNRAARARPAAWNRNTEIDFSLASMLFATTTSERWPGRPSSARPARGPTAGSERTADDSSTTRPREL